MRTGQHGNCLQVIYWTVLLITSQYTGSVAGNCKDKFKVIQGHSACLTKSSKVTESGLSAAEKSNIVNLHNKYRRMVTEAADMFKVRWDDEVAMVAQKWAENCQTGHDKGQHRYIPGRFSVGQNIASSPANSKRDWDSIVQLWYDEESKFTYGLSSQTFSNVGHYTQLVWAETYLIGCGYALCGNTHFYVCDYAPGGNTQGRQQTPYNRTSGTQGSACKTNKQGLCDCGSKACNGDRGLDPSTCTCICDATLKPAFVSGGTCQINCDVPDVKSSCGATGSFKPSSCDQVFTTFYCPHMCHTCPYADPSYVDDSGAVTLLQKSWIISFWVSLALFAIFD